MPAISHGICQMQATRVYRMPEDAIRLAYSSSRPWWRSTVVERRSLTGELSLSCAPPAADG